MREAALPRGQAHSWAVAVVIAATYFYFLLFAEFAFISLARPQFPSADAMRIFMGTLGAAGILGSCLAALAALAARTSDWPRRLSAGLGACAIAGLLSLVLRHRTAFLLDAAGVGAALGWTTVTLAAGLGRALPTRLGAWTGLGTGLAYGGCNLPGIFTARPAVQTLLAGALAAAAAIVALRLRSEGPAPQPAMPGDFTPLGRGRWITILLALVWLDSAAFFIIQNTPALKTQTWAGNKALAINAAVHLAAALLAGLALDRSRRASLSIAAWLLLATACVLLRQESAAGAARFFYTAGVSLYSVLLVYYPAAGGKPWLAATVYGVAGWLGSALGIGMAQELHQVPSWFLSLSGAAIAAALLLKPWRARPSTVAAAGLFLLASIAAGAAPAPDALIARGRAVYIGEGCIHCHSQYIRPGTLDVEWWGPADSSHSAGTETPPLLGNRRQGPDLTNVGNRRSPEWERLHLIAPSEVSPGSRMPSYARLFQSGNRSGDALVAYLLSLGADTAPERFAFVREWRPGAPAPGAGGEAGRRLFRSNCIQCHGSEGNGGGPLALRLNPRPADLVHGLWRYAPAYGSDPTSSLARMIKYGIAGTSMPGHEWLSDAEILALVRTVQDLHAHPETR